MGTLAPLGLIALEVDAFDRWYSKKKNQATIWTQPIVHRSPWKGSGSAPAWEINDNCSTNWFKFSCELVDTNTITKIL